MAAGFDCIADARSRAGGEPPACLRPISDAPVRPMANDDRLLRQRLGPGWKSTLRLDPACSLLSSARCTPHATADILRPVAAKTCSSRSYDGKIPPITSFVRRMALRGHLVLRSLRVVNLDV